jgi:hypothetical protein
MEHYKFASRGSKAADQKVIDDDNTSPMHVPHGAADLHRVWSIGDHCPAATKEQQQQRSLLFPTKIWK